MNEVNILVFIINMLAAVTFILFAVPFLRGEVRMNRFYGYRIAKAYESEEKWKKINKHFARGMLRCAIVLILIAFIGLLVPLDADMPIIASLLAMAPLILIVPVIQTYQYSRTL
jgi:hypothetical protein